MLRKPISPQEYSLFNLNYLNLASKLIGPSATPFQTIHT